MFYPDTIPNVNDEHFETDTKRSTAQETTEVVNDYLNINTADMIKADGKTPKAI